MIVKLALDRSERKTTCAAVLAALLLLSAPVGAQEADTCTLTDEQFFQQMATMKTWSDIHAVYERNLPACPDDGSYAEGYSSVVEDTLARHWSTLPELRTLVVRDPGFGSFVLGHIDALANEKNLRKMLRSARAHCPADAAQLCADIAARADAALKETQ